jgi:polysaccharide export outer membrane protein
MRSPTKSSRPIGAGLLLCLILACASGTGCQAFMLAKDAQPVSPPVPDTSDFPTEGNRVSLPPHRIGPTDLLNIQALKVVPRPPYKIQTYDVLRVTVIDGPQDQLVGGRLTIEPDGRINLGAIYGKVSLVDLTLDQAKYRITQHIEQITPGASVSVAMLASSGTQQIAGQHMVGPDGRVNLGKYGSVHLAGLTTDEASDKIEAQLVEYLQDPEVFVDIFSHNSSGYYIITQSKTQGDNVARLAITGNETVMDAISAMRGISQVSSHRIWISRPAPSGEGPEQILPVDWTAITRRGDGTTNYQIFPGDRVFIAEDRVIAATGYIGKITAPFQRVFGFVNLGTQTLNAIERFGRVQ